MENYFIKARHTKRGTSQVVTFKDADDFFAQLKLWISQDINDETFHNTYVYECFVRVEKDK